MSSYQAGYTASENSGVGYSRGQLDGYREGLEVGRGWLKEAQAEHVEARANIVRQSNSWSAYAARMLSSAVGVYAGEIEHDSAIAQMILLHEIQCHSAGNQLSAMVEARMRQPSTVSLSNRPEDGAATALTQYSAQDLAEAIPSIKDVLPEEIQDELARAGRSQA